MSEQNPSQQPEKKQVTVDDLAQALMVQAQTIAALRDQINQLGDRLNTLLQAQAQRPAVSKEDALAFAQMFAQFMQPRSDPLSDAIREAMMQHILSSVQRTKTENAIFDAIMKAIAKKVGVETEAVTETIFK